MKPTIVITGASRGIGRAATLRFAQDSCHIVINSLTPSGNLEKLKKEVEELGCDCLAVTGDIGNPAFVEYFYTLIRERFPCPDIWVNNAGVSKIKLMTETSIEEWNHLLTINLSSCFYCSHAVVPDMIARKSGKIINISSIWGCVGASCETAYSAAKGGMNAFTKALAKELAPSNIQVNAIAFGVIDTDMNQCFSEEELSYLKEEIPVGRIASPQEAANMIHQVAHMDSYFTGQVIRFDGAFL